MSMKTILRIACLTSLGVLLGGCPLGLGGGSDIAPALKSLPAETQGLLAKAGMTQESPIFVRIFKEESELEIWKQKADGRYYLFKAYPICTWSGELGPKVVEGDKQSPEGFYTITPGQMNPNSQFHLAFNLGYPNDFVKANGRTGAALMVHGDCRSAGCFAMTDALIEEIYALAREAFRGGQTKFHVHAFPFRMTKANMERHKKSKWTSFWRTLKVGYDDFELTRMPPKINVCSRQYLVNADFMGHVATPDASDACPAYRRLPVSPFNPLGDGQVMAQGAAGSNPRLAAYSTPAPASSAAATRFDPPRQAATFESRSQPAQPAPFAAARSQPTATIAPASNGEPPVALGSAQPPQRAPSLALQQTPTMAAASTEDAAEKARREEQVHSEAPGLHNVSKSGKGDMMPPPAAPAQ